MSDNARPAGDSRMVPTCGICGERYASETDASSCEEMHALAHEEMGVFDEG